MADAPRLRVLFLTHSYPRVPGDAAGSFLLHLATALRGEGVEVRVIAPAGEGLPAHDTFDGIRVDRFHYAPRRYENLAYTGEMAQEVQRSWRAKVALVGFLGAQFGVATRVRREFSPQLVHAHWWFPGGLVGTWVAGLGRLPLVTTMHGTDVRLARAKSFARPLFRRVMHQSRAVTTVSRWLAAEVHDMVPDVTPLVAPMPVSTALFAPWRHARQTACSSWDASTPRRGSRSSWMPSRACATASTSTSWATAPTHRSFAPRPSASESPIASPGTGRFRRPRCRRCISGPPPSSCRASAKGSGSWRSRRSSAGPPSSPSRVVASPIP
ncbi:MAG: glycosyltransferase [Gemmatimonadetes bacterium]|nr:glycosyltransferase [Gemmatimonadota bacterium]